MGRDLGGGGKITLQPYQHHPADVGGVNRAAWSLTDLGRRGIDMNAVIDVTMKPAIAGWSGLAAPELQASPAPVKQSAVQTSASLVWIGGCMRQWADAVYDFNRKVDQLKRQLEIELDAQDDLEAGLDRDIRDGDQTDESVTRKLRDQWAAARRAAGHRATRSWEDSYQTLLDERSAVTGMLAEGPTAANIRKVRAQGSIPEYLLGVFPQYARSHVNELRLLTLNVAGGHGNFPLDSDGMDPGDIDELATRILDENVDVATLQEIWGKDVKKLEDKLNRRDPGGDWELEFGQASTKRRADDAISSVVLVLGGLGGAAVDIGLLHDQPFGNAIAVRRGSGEDALESQLVGEAKLDDEGADGSDGRSMLMVEVATPDGGVVNIATAHTDPKGVSDTKQAEQIDRLREYAEDDADGDPLVIAGDLNHAPVGDRPQADALRDYVEDGGYTDAGDVGPTSDNGKDKRIDYIFTSPELAPGDPTRVQGDSPDKPGDDTDLSDHDGIVVDVGVPTSGRSLGHGTVH